jgi:aminomethyltransferase
MTNANRVGHHTSLRQEPLVASSPEKTDKKTVLFDLHKSLGARIVPFGGWAMPVSYSSVLQEHKTVREQCGIFDVSHMGEVFVSGKKAAAFLQKLTINDIERLSIGGGQYSAILNESGGMIDDLIIYKIADDRFLICVNASNKDKDYNWFKNQAVGESDVKVEDKSDEYSQIAVQGPTSLAAMEAVLPADAFAAIKGMDYMQIREIKAFGHHMFVARTGYTGEWGYEVYLPNAAAPHLWEALLSTNARTGVAPIGLGARDTLRLEACYLLYGNDMDDTVSPLEAGIEWATRLDGADFIGKSKLTAQKAAGVKRKNFAFQMEGDGIPRSGMDIFFNGEPVGRVTSGSVLPTVGGAGGMALIDPTKVKIGDSIEIDVRGKRKLARVAKKPLYKAKVRG